MLMGVVVGRMHVLTGVCVCVCAYACAYMSGQRSTVADFINDFHLIFGEKYLMKLDLGGSIRLANW